MLQPQPTRFSVEIQPVLMICCTVVIIGYVMLHWLGGHCIGKDSQGL